MTKVWKKINDVPAPKDGTSVILRGGQVCKYDWPEAGERTVIAYWDVQFDCWLVARYDSCMCVSYEEPTHWMEIPEFGVTP